MFRKKTSRPASANSQSGRVSRPHSAHDADDSEDSSKYSEDDIVMNGLQPFDNLTSEQAKHLKFTKENPLGRILIDLIHDQINLAEKVGLKKTNSNLKELCTAFYNSTHLIEHEKEKDLEIKMAEIENNIIQRELNSHLLNQDCKVPEHFSPMPKLLTPGKRAECLRVFPTRQQKFTGSNSPNVLEFLGMMNSAQQQCNLSRKEFEDMLLHCTTGQAHMLLMDWISHGDSIEYIFYNFMLHYDRRLAPEEARLQLLTYRVPKSAALQKVESKIMMLATRASSNLPPGASRAANFNNEAITALIRALPATSKITVQNTYNSISAKLGRSCTFTELTKALNIVRHSIDADIKENGEDQSTDNTGQYDHHRYSQERQPSTFYVDMSHDECLEGLSQDGFDKFGSTESLGNGTNNEFQYNYQDRPERKKQNGFHNFSTPDYEQYCILCGHTDHSAEDDCPFMQADNGKVITVFPLQYTCTRCPFHVSPRLNHPKRVCPYRVGGPLNDSD